MKRNIDFLINPILCMIFFLMFASSCTKNDESDHANTFTDARDGHVYKTITIGSQVWMAENLKYLPSVVGSGTGSKSTPYYYIYGYIGIDVAGAKATFNYSTYGVLYNWPAAMSGDASSDGNPSHIQGVCPNGWHLPSDAEWTQLTTYLGNASSAADRIKTTDTLYWNGSNTSSTNESGFTALGGGVRYYDGKFHDVGYFEGWWSATETSDDLARSLGVFSYSNLIFKGSNSKEEGFYIRCVKD